MTTINRPVKSHWVVGMLVVLALSGLYFGVRIDNTETLVTNDEPFWLGRSANFQRALTQWEPEHTYQMAHPGVPVMWAGAIAFWIHAPGYSNTFHDNTDWPFFIDDRLVASGIHPLEMLQHARIVKLGFETILFAISVCLVLVLGTRLLATLAGILITFDPFLAGFGALLHVDSLLTMALLAASLAIAWALQKPDERIPWTLAGVIAAIAVLTRSTGVVIGIPLLYVLVLICKSHNISRSIKMAGIWIAGFAVTYIALWPALWVDPFGTARKMIDWTLGAASGGHEHALFFAGEIHQDDPGWLFYPVTILWRTSPLIWVGIILFCVGLRSERVRAWVRPFLPVILLGIAYFLVMSLGAKKFDRYVLPVYPVLSLMAAFGFQVAISWLQDRLAQFRQFVPAAGMATVALFALIPISNAGPYKLNYYNGIMRQLDGPENAIQIGWGEGAYEATEFLKGESERLGRPIVAQTFAIPSDQLVPPVRYFVIDETGLIEDVTFRQTGMNTPEDWLNTDYYLFNIQQTQRGMAPDYELFRDADPVHTVEFGGVVIWEVYAPNQLPVPDVLSND